MTDAAAGPPPRTIAVEHVRRLFAGRSIAVNLALAVVALWLLVGFLGPYVAPYSPTATNVTADAVPPFAPSADHLMGTDQLGRDLLTRILYGLRTSIVVGVVVRSVVMLVGGILGSAGAMLHRVAGGVIMRAADVTLSMPALLVAMAVTAILGPSLPTLVLAIAVTGWPEVARIAYGETLSIREREFVTASYAFGGSSPHIFRRHIVPNMARQLGVAWSIGIPGAIMYEAGLSYFGFGIQPPGASLGTLMAEGQDFVQVAPWMMLFPTLILALVVVTFNVAGDVIGRSGDTRTSHLQ